MSQDVHDLRLLRAWQAGDERAGNTLLIRLFPMVYRFFASKLDRGVEDLAQRTFETCVASKERIPEHGGLRVWVLRVARNHLLHELRARMRHEQRLEPLETSIADIVESPSGFVAALDEQRILAHALRCLPLDFQITLELYYWEELSVREIAIVLGVEAGTVRSRLHRGRQLLERGAMRAEKPSLVRQSTMRSLESWVRSLRALLEP